MSNKLLRRLLLFPVFLIAGVELILWIFVRIPLEPLKPLELSNELPGLKKDVHLKLDRILARYLDDASGAKPEGTVRILCLGGTATFALFQNAEDAWWGKLGRLLQSQGHAVQVAAWGQDRIGIVATLPYAATLIEDWQPDLVIANFGFDDVVGQPVDYRYVPVKARGISTIPGPAGWKQAILKVSQIARLGRWQARHAHASLLQNKIGRPNYWAETMAGMKKQVAAMPQRELPPRDPVQDPLLEFMDGWQALHDLCARHGLPLVVTSEPSLHDADINLTRQENLIALVPLNAEAGENLKPIRPFPAWVEREQTRYAEAAENFAASRNLPWLNLHARVPRDLDHFFSDVILTDVGAALVARELLPVVEPLVKTLGKR